MCGFRPWVADPGSTIDLVIHARMRMTQIQGNKIHDSSWRSLTTIVIDLVPTRASALSWAGPGNTARPSALARTSGQQLTKPCNSKSNLTLSAATRGVI